MKKTRISWLGHFDCLLAPNQGHDVAFPIFRGIARPTESAAIEQLHPRCSFEAIGRWYWRYPGIGACGI